MDYALYGCQLLYFIIYYALYDCHLLYFIMLCMVVRMVWGLKHCCASVPQEASNVNRGHFGPITDFISPLNQEMNILLLKVCYSKFANLKSVY